MPKFNNVDLNLYRVFDVIYTEGNLTRAGEVLCITQPSVSNALARLRDTFGDPLFVRTSVGMTPTPVAQNAIGKVRAALDLMRSSLQEVGTFLPEESDRIFRFSIADLAELLILPELLETLSQIAPGVSVDCRHLNYEDSLHQMASAQLDFTVAAQLHRKEQLAYSPLLLDDYVCVVRKGHPALKRPLTLESYLQLKHINLSRQKQHETYEDRALYKLGYNREIALWAQSYSMAPNLVRRTDLALTVPRQLAIRSKLPFMELPFHVPPLELFLYWHKNVDLDPAICWLRDQILSLNLELSTS
ncbi:LysR family transcriptional regulator [Haliea sp.]|jgi:DNA-binding transcriptional LysR family regulator|uniref:LysR family transcriptional regulator n=1 Tax=Haliea sp. TaxID=1932666 RepID=UPI000C635711|nr:LysR family transcriptional regulator [Haliea sp.]MAD63068.1 LysR family transcriptional regulator [Haliea sp.]MAY91539.1 LysR family transcriptional regulator [Haliea sp.]MBK40522.1 LysR family transcriptional regulator [Haliea sp.]MBP68621.1 LysR family transcriptional regulator [Haliea sp.]|tara:strand:- start:4450 stop:5355 length:906 start_codon:yes stop_codon:yes gene_type:complete